MLSSTVERIGRILLLCMPTLLALVFYPNLEAPFTDAKSALFHVLLGVVVCAALAIRGFPDSRSELRPLRSATVLLVVSAIVSFAFSQWRYLGGIAVVWPLTGALLFSAVAVPVTIAVAIAIAVAIVARTPFESCFV